MVFQFRLTKLIGALALAFFAFACSSTSQQTESKKDKGNIYDALHNDEIQYRDDTQRPSSDLDQQLVQQHITQIRNQYFRKNLSEATVIAERLLRLDSNIPEAYYWLARIRLDQGDYQQAYNMATKGLTVTDDANLKREMERVQRQAQMGNY